MEIIAVVVFSFALGFLPFGRGLWFVVNPDSAYQQYRYSQQQLGREIEATPPDSWREDKALQGFVLMLVGVLFWVGGAVAVVMLG